MNSRTVIAIARKDFLDAVRNARLLVIVLMPIGFSALYGYLFRDTPSTLEVVLHTPDSTALVEELASLPTVSLFVVDSPQAVETTLEKEKGALGVILPSGFDEALLAGERPKVELVYRESRDDTPGVERMILQMIEAISGRSPVVEVLGRSLNPQLEGGNDENAPLSFFTGLDLQRYFVVLWVMLGITMNGSFLVPTLLVEEKDKKTLSAILVTPAGYVEVIVGKLLIGMIYSLLTSLVVMVINDGFTGDFGFSIAIVMIASLTLTLLGLLIGGLIDNMSTLNTWGGFIMLPLMLPGLLAGVPIESLGPVITIPLQAIPTFQLVRGFSLALSSRGGEVWGSLIVLMVECVILFGGVQWSLRRQEA